MAGVALRDIDRHFAWQAWHWWHWAGSGGALGSRFVPWARPLFAWQGWHLATSTVTLRGRRGTWRHRSPLCVTGVALMALDWLWCHTKLFHTILSQIHFTHNFVTHNSLAHNFVTYITFTHKLLHTTLSHTTLSHTTLLHTQTYTHNTVTHSSFTQPVSHHLLSFLPFPSHFHICLVITGRSWFVGLSGLIFGWALPRSFLLLPPPSSRHGHAQLTHTQLTLTQLTHTQLTHTQLTLTPLNHTLALTQLTHTHNFLTHNFLTHNLLPHNLLTSTFTLRGRRGTWRHRRAFSSWQAWHLWHWAGSGGALGSHLVPWARPLFAWQRWHLATSTCTLRGRCGTYGTGLALVARLVPSGRRCRRGCLRGRPGTWRHRPALCVAAVALMALGWLWWRAWFPFGAVGAAAVCIAGVALMALDWLWWRAWAPDCQTVIGVLL